MEIKQRFTVAHQQSLVWEALADAKFAAQCMPGAELDESADGRRYKGRMRVKLGPLAAAFAGEATVDRDEQTKTGSVDWTGVDARSNSRAKGQMTYAVLSAAEGQAAVVEIQALVALTGALAQFGRSGIINDVATRLTSIFADNLQTRLNSVVAAKALQAHRVPSDHLGEGKKPTAALSDDGFKAAELNPLELFWGVLRSRLANGLRGWADRIDGTHPKS